MTNAKKFEEVFGIKPDIESMVIDCTVFIGDCKFGDCKYFEIDGCHCEKWWDEEYKEVGNNDE